MGRKIIFLGLILLWIAVQTIAQTPFRTIRGIVTNEEDGEPVIGASVAVKGTTQGTVTDAEGHFVIDKVSAQAQTLVVSYIGLVTQEVAVKPEVRVILKPNSKLLDEVVVTALGISREKKALGYTAQEVKSEALTTGKENNLLNSLSGKIAGVRITNT